MVREYYIYFTIDYGTEAEPHVIYGQLLAGTSENMIPYDVLAGLVNVNELARWVGTTPDKVKLITPEEYARRFDDENNE